MNRISLYETALDAERGGRYSEAFRLFQRCLEVVECDPGDIYFHMGWCHEQDPNGDEVDAIAMYQKAADIAGAPSCRLNGMFRAGWLLMHEKEYLMAATMFRIAIDYGESIGLMTETYHHALYWYAVCAESQGRYLDALKWYRRAQRMSPQLDPESRFRQILCLNQIGSYAEALDVCRSFGGPPPDGFDSDRYLQLSDLAGREGEMLRSMLTEDSHARRIERAHVR